MPNIYNTYNNEQTRHSDDMQDIITAVPSWLLKWGISLFFGILVLIIGISALIRYPDTVKCTLKIDSSNSPKAVTAKTSGKLIKLQVTQHEVVKAGQPLAWLESTANHEKVLSLLTNLKQVQQQIAGNKPLTIAFTSTDDIGELHIPYQAFLNDYNQYKLLNNESYSQKAKFSQALNYLITAVEDWQNKYVLTAPQSGRVSFAGIIQQNQEVNANQEVFYIVQRDETFFGEMAIPQENMGKIREGQCVLIKLKAYPFEEYGIIKGRIKYITEIPYQGNMYMAKVDFGPYKSYNANEPINLKQGMIADAEIITQDATILKRISRSFKLF